ncbi:WD domain-containing protein [Cladophialophora immunda]|nr:WD domain-containing protein [Cladophialophora immunda]
MMPSIKRQASDSFSQPQALVKRQKSSSDLNDNKALTVGAKDQNGTLVPSALRTSGLAAPIMELTGTRGRFSQQDLIPLGAVLDLQWSRDSRTIYSASADMTIASWDLETGLRMRKHVGHEEVINCLDLSRRGQDLLLSGSDDGCIGIWDPRQKAAVDYIETDFPITAVAMAEQGHEIYSGGIDNDIKVWDARKMEVTYTLSGHQDTITSLEVSPDSQTLLSNSHDSTVRTWDIRPFAPVDRAVQTYDGAPSGFEKNLIRASWNPQGDKICAGAGDRTVVIWDTASAKLLYKLPGHKGTVNDVRFSPTEEPIIVSGSTDRNLILAPSHPHKQSSFCSP